VRILVELGVRRAVMPANTKTYITPLVGFATTDTVGRRYSIVGTDDEGFLYYDRLGDLYDQGNLRPSYLLPGQTLEHGTLYTPLHCRVKFGSGDKQVDGFIPRPFLRQSPQVTGLAKELVLPEASWDSDLLQHNYSFTPGDRNTVPASGETQAYYPLTYWDIVRSADGLFWEMQQKESGDSTDGYRFSRVSVGYPDPPTAAVSATDPYADQEAGLWQGVVANPFFVAGFRHQAIGEAGQAYALSQMQAGVLSYLYATQIVWGDGAWMLWIPWRGAPKLYRNAAYHSDDPYWALCYPTDWEYCQWDGGSLSDINPETAANKGYTYCIGVVKGNVCVWEGDWDGQCAHFDASGQGEPVVPTGSLYIQNYPGQCTYWLDLLQGSAEMKIGRRKFWTGQATIDTVDAQVWGAPGDVMRNMNGIAPTETTTIPGIMAGTNTVDLDVYCDPETPEYLHYVLTATPGLRYTVYRESGDLPSLKTYTFPFVDAVSIWQPTVLTDNGALFFTSAEEIVPQGLRFENELRGSRAQAHTFRAYNGAPGFLPDEALVVPTEGLPRTYRFKPGAQVKVSVAWRMFDTETGEESWSAVTDVGQYTIMRAEPGKMETDADATDLLGIAALARWTRGVLNFRGWYVKDALEFLCDLLAIGTAERDFEDIGTDAQVPKTDESAEYKPGKNFAEIMVDLVRRYGQDSTLWYDGATNKLKTGCKYCRAKRTTTDTGGGVLEWMTHNDNGWASSGCLAVDAARVPTDSIDYHIVDDPDATGVEAGSLLFTTAPVIARTSGLAREGYANEIVVTGMDATGKIPLQARWRNPNAFDPTHDDWVAVRVTKYEDLGDGQTQYSVNDRCAELTAIALSWPLDVKVELVLHPEIVVGYVMQVQGGSYAGVDQKKFRVTAVRSDAGGQSTTVEGHEIKAVFEEAE
jgi:hypothetical protein